MTQALQSFVPAPRSIESRDESLVDFTTRLAQEHESATEHESRRDIGQVFTPPAVCRFMANLLGPIGKSYHLLDPGAGTGSLSAAVCERVLALKTRRQLVIELYENDSTVLPFLKRGMDECRRRLRQAGHELSYNVHAEDFVLSRAKPGLFNSEDGGPFDGVVMNPPYFKIAKGSAHALAVSDVVHGQPNIYALFMAVAAERLQPSGSLVAITPRSYCNGLYFREFRRWFFERVALRQLHLFESRRSTFKESQVLQESLITLVSRRRRDQSPAATVTISTSVTRDMSDMAVREHPASSIIDDTAGDMVVRVPAAPIDAEIIEAVESWPAKFADLGLRISTGPVVTFRAREHLLSNADIDDAVPLLSVHNVKPFQTVWPVAKGRKPIAFRVCNETRSQVLPRRNYVLLRRFSAKEEARRLTAAAYLPPASERAGRVALENHLNYVYAADGELSQDETVGLTALFNSALLDRYFRILSGNTQVNATEIRTMPFPDLKTVAKIGSEVRKAGTSDRDKVERIVLHKLGINGSISRELLGETA